MGSRGAAAARPRPVDEVCVAHVDHASMTHWLPAHARTTYRTRLLPLPDDFVAYLRADGPLILPKTQKVARAVARGGIDNFDVDELLEDDLEDDEDDEDALAFPDLERAIDAAISSLGGVAFCKLNWSAPRDAGWMTGNSLECRCAADVFVLLKASDFAAHDSSRAFDRCVDLDTAKTNTVLTLALRQFRLIEPSSEFRCFVRADRLTAASQRQTDEAFSALASREAVDRVREQISVFFDDNLRARHADADFVFDVAVLSESVTLVDVNVLSRSTDSKLFDWDELESIASSFERADGPTRFDSFELRVAQDCAGKEMRAAELSSFRAPADVLDLHMLGGIEALIARQRADDSDDSSDDEDPTADGFDEGDDG
ncbi:D123-domain-containing protein [Pelagophyceae sp. CCMP2097]|nr:D123-domain-containing protein [Pelagophyceae sp. CCMP2097]|mmetsp:Transcript_28807/g.99234  ORF Transcript_28807/g.99234 Transcript_28807/m.99234 type:complete len:372 (-) Transcript_28807:29-1144(-)